MATKFFYMANVVLLTVVLASCATSDPSDDFSFDYSQVEISHFNGYWEGRVDCRYADGYMPLPWVRILDGRGEIGFGKGVAGIGFTLDTLSSDFDPENGQVSWQGEILIDQAWGSKKRPVSFRGRWRDRKFELKGTINKRVCTGALNKISS